jgi:hypothetical protein
MQEFILIILVAFLLLGFLRRFFFFSSYHGFQKAAEEFMKKHQPKQKPEGTVTIQKIKDRKESSGTDKGEYVDYEEVR